MQELSSIAAQGYLDLPPLSSLSGQQVQQPHAGSAGGLHCPPSPLTNMAIAGFQY